MKNTQREQAALAFSEEWKNRGDEKSDTQQFWMSLLSTVYGIAKPQHFIAFEKRVQLSHVSFIDAYIESTKVLIEQKSCDIDLHKGYRQSDGSMLTPFQQAKRYANEMPYSSRPRWVVVCNFKSFLIYDMEVPNGEPEEILLENFEKEYYRLSFLVEEKSIHLQKEMEISLKAGEIIGEIYDELLKQYIAPDDESFRSLNVLCVRIVFCLFAEDAGIFNSHSLFHDYLAKFKPGEGDMRDALIKLFEVLDTPVEKRDKYLRPELKAFPYCNGGLFSDKSIEIPFFNEKIAKLLLKNASSDFDWSEISPTIFGALFESTLNPETRRSGGMHYTSIENIHKVIDPLFLNDLNNEFDEIKNISIEKNRMSALSKFQDKLASLSFLDPACGSGNFLTETFLSLRRLENQVIMELSKGQTILGFDDHFSPVKVNIHQFYGIEINDFAVDVATTALWIAESQMLKETQKIINRDLEFLPLKTYRNIKKGNALRESWTEWDSSEPIPDIYAKETNLYLVEERPSLEASEPDPQYGIINLHTEKLNINPSKNRSQTVRFDYIMGNPPFVGHQYRCKSQMEDMDYVFDDFDSYGKLDYVTAWLKKAADIMQNTNTRAAFVSTNSICQGESVTLLWRPFFEKKNLEINFAYRTFRWDSESSLKAHVHCVIIGFSCHPFKGNKIIFLDDNQYFNAKNINGYLLDAPNVFIQNRGKSIVGMPEMTKGSQPTDGGNLILSENEKKELIEKYPQCVNFVRRFIGADDFINNKIRYCLWLKDVSPEKYRNISPIRERLLRIKELRLQSPTKTVQKDADTPMLFTQIRQPEQCNYLLVPSVSSERRKYVPMGFLDASIIASDAVQIIPNANKYLFGILTSNVHMAWMRVVAGRLKSDYRYSPAIYKNFPWPEPNETQKAKIEQTAQAILDARTKYPDSSLADLYDEATMPPELRKAHQENDKAVMQAYGFNIKMTESECVAELFKLYDNLIQKLSSINKVR